MLLAIEAGDLPDPGSNGNVLPLFKNLRKEMEEKRQLVIVADTTSATGSEKNAASAVKSAGRKISPARKINFRKAEQKSASFTLPRAVVSSTSGYCMASGMIIKVNRLI